MGTPSYQLPVFNQLMRVWQIPDTPAADAALFSDYPAVLQTRVDSAPETSPGFPRSALPGVYIRFPIDLVLVSAFKLDWEWSCIELPQDSTEYWCPIWGEVLHRDFDNMYGAVYVVQVKDDLSPWWFGPSTLPPGTWNR